MKKFRKVGVLIFRAFAVILGLLLVWQTIVDTVTGTNDSFSRSKTISASADRNPLDFFGGLTFQLAYGVALILGGIFASSERFWPEEGVEQNVEEQTEDS